MRRPHRPAREQRLTRSGLPHRVRRLTGAGPNAVSLRGGPLAPSAATGCRRAPGRMRQQAISRIDAFLSSSASCRAACARDILQCDRESNKRVCPIVSIGRSCLTRRERAVPGETETEGRLRQPFHQQKHAQSSSRYQHAQQREKRKISGGLGQAIRSCPCRAGIGRRWGSHCSAVAAIL